MGKPKKRVRPSITSSVNRNIDALYIQQLYKAISSMAEPYAVDPRGNPHQPRLVVMCLILKFLFCKAYDEIESYVKNSAHLKRLFRTKRMPTHSVIQMAMEKTDMKYLRRLIRTTLYRTVKKTGFKDMVVVPDSSGFRLKSSSAWYDIRIKRMNKRKDCLKMHVLVDTETGQVLYAVITNYKRHDSPVFEMLARGTKGTFKKVPGDAGYISRKNCTIVVNRGGKPYFMPKSNTGTKSKGHPAYKIMVRAYKKDKVAWLDEYHIRSFVESVFSSIKRRFRSIISSIKGWNRRKELLWKVLCYNLKELLYCLRADELGISKWIECK